MGKDLIGGSHGHHVSRDTRGTKAPRPWAHVGDVRAGPLRGPFCWTIKHKPAPEGFRTVLKPLCTAQVLGATPSVWYHWHHQHHTQTEAIMSRSFYVDSLIFKDPARPALSEHTGQDFLIPIGMHSPGLMSVTAPVCPSRKTGTFCVCPLCVTSHIHSPRGGIPLLKGQGFSAGDAAFCQRVAHQQSTALAHPGHGHPPTCYSVTDPRRYHCLSLGECVRAQAIHLLLLMTRRLTIWQFIEFKSQSSRILPCFVLLFIDFIF